MITEDSIKLAKKNKSKMEKVNEFRSLTKIYPIGENEVETTLLELRNIFYSIAPVKSKEKINGNNFEKLLKNS